MDAAQVITDARHRSGRTLRALANRAGTSHSTLAAYEHGHKVPSVATLDRIVRAAGYAADITLNRRMDSDDPAARGRELIQVLELAAMFPATHSPTITFPRFGAVNVATT
jgi:transcriptional regulator with XRE-family HTH domain